MKGKLTLTSMFTVAVLPLASISKVPEGSKPNIVIILTDDMGYGDMNNFLSLLNNSNLDHIILILSALTIFVIYI